MTVKQHFLYTLIFLNSFFVFGQHHHTVFATYNEIDKTIHVKQKTTFVAQNLSEIDSLVFNDWNNAYWEKKSPLGYRFSDEFVRSFHLSTKSERGKTELISFKTNQINSLDVINRDFDLLKIPNNFKNQTSIDFELEYVLTLPDSKFSGYGIDKNGNVILKDWLILPSKIENGKMLAFHNENLLDAALPKSNFDITFVVNSLKPVLFSSNSTVISQQKNIYSINKKDIKNIEIQLLTDSKLDTISYLNHTIYTNLQDQKINSEQRKLSIQKILEFVNQQLLIQNPQTILVSQFDYQKSPLYGLNQLPSFISPFENELIFELKFLKTYISKLTYDNFSHNPRTETWITDGYQTYLIMEYINTFYPNLKMLGYLSKYKILNYYTIFQRDFNDQFEIVYLLMARKNLDQPIGDSKETFIKFNEQISGRYKAGLNFKYLSDYLGKESFVNKIQLYSLLSQTSETSEIDFFNLLKDNPSKPTEWFSQLVHTNELIDYRIKGSKVTKDGIALHLKNKTTNKYPITIYTAKNDTISNKLWINGFVNDTIIQFKDKNQKFVLNYFGEVPEINRNNNWHNPNGFLGINKPIKLTFFKDVEDPNSNQIFFLPEFGYNYYDGISPAISFNNKSVFVKPFTFDVAPTLSWRTKKLIGNTSFSYNQIYRNQKLYNIRYNIFAHTYHYAENARYYKFSPSINFSFRDTDLRKNANQNLLFRYVILDREKSEFLNPRDENYSVLNIKYNGGEHEFTRLFRHGLDLQIANKFGKASGEVHFRKLFSDNRHLTIRGYAGIFLYHKTESNFFDFGVDKPTDYLYDYNWLGRSETSGIYSQQFILAEGGFKSIFKNRFANQWLTTANFSYTIWNWVEGYSDFGVMKSKETNSQFIYDTGIRLNLVQDYFELYFPIYSNNGWEFNNNNYNERVRFVFTFSPKTLFSLFSRKWF